MTYRFAEPIPPGLPRDEAEARVIAALTRDYPNISLLDIEREFGVSYHPRYLERPLKAHGFSVQRPATRARSGPVRLEPHWKGWSYMLSAASE